MKAKNLSGVRWLAYNDRVNTALVARVLVMLPMVVVVAGCQAAIDPLAIADAQTAARVKTALINDPDLGVRILEVRVVRGVVELSGRVLTQAEADRAVALSRAVSGVVDVRSTLRVGGEADSPPEGQSEAGSPPEGRSEGGTGPEFDSPELQDNPGFLAIGGSIGWSTPRAAALKSRVAFSPLIKLGSGSGLGLAVGLDWFHAEIQSLEGPVAVLTRVQVKPIMLGSSYTVTTARASLSASVVGGYAWNSLTITDTGIAAGLPVEVDNSLTWRPGVSLWYDLTRKTALNLSVGHVRTGLRVTVLCDGRLEKRKVRGDTTIVHAGIAYRLF
jgi:hypothetical protein